MFLLYVIDGILFNIYYIKSCVFLLREVKESNCIDCKLEFYVIFDNVMYRKDV